ncbi:hypothetical protein MC7420_891 [Coleofasciculus chthonoplastes PCC 7420]|uniref:Uncharacterized protein n=1 Tax=Coleofasciculus chthonoplastes PCC 7420 TaxID=118168 RepID=B4VT09_9CYAN|nr:hypothetical protein [Coleofasciculus chthonoplastes]EDX75017.1 hypothetical protein MC7420_891 [Coleofasciculus chthonoplastes PCC 7420]
MKFLTYREINQLQKILINNIVLQTSDVDFRNALLTNCGLGKYCSLIPLDKPSLQFVPILYRQLSEIHITIDAAQRLGLIVFLEHISQLDIISSLEEKSFINHVITKWEQQQTSSTQKSQRNKIANLLAQGRKESPTVAPVQQPSKVDRGVIINYDLEAQMAKFRQQVGYEGAFVFAVGGHNTILEQYIIERLRRELKQKTERQNERLEIRLYRKSILTSTDIEREFLNKYKFEYFTELFNAQGNTDIMLIIWNYDIPEKIMKSLAEDFWANISSSVSPCLKNQSRCLVIVWANVGKRPLTGLTGLTALPNPKKFKLCDLLPWFRSKLRMEGIEENLIEYYLDRLERQCGNGDLIGTYQEINQIVQELQGGSRLYG